MQRLFFLFVLIVAQFTVKAQCGGIDIFIANDQSGSVDANENLKSREFIAVFCKSLYLAHDENGYRVAIADWDYNQGWAPYNFPVAGIGFTTEFSDVLSYTNSQRVLIGGTDLVTALQKSFVAILSQDNNRAKVILLMTDAVLGVTQPALVDLAQQVKNSGVYIALLSISTPYNPLFEDVASEGGYFMASSYEELVKDAKDFTSAITTASCLGTEPAFDLNIKLTAFTAENCFPGPGNYKVEYEIKNSGKLPWNDSIAISLYNGDVAVYGNLFVTSFKTGKVIIEPGETYKGFVEDDILQRFKMVTAIVNFDGKVNTLSLPIYGFEIYDRLYIKGERSSINNFSNPINKVNGDGCIPKANVLIDVNAVNLGCDDMVVYNVSICNTGNQDTRLANLLPVAHEKFSLVHADINIDNTITKYTNTYFGGLQTDYAYTAATDLFGGIYIAGQTNSTNNIATPGVHRTSNAGTEDAFLVKFNAEGDRVWATYFGGIGPENGYSIATDKQGNVYMTGETSISTNIATAGAHQMTNGGNIDAYLAKFSSTGVLLWATYYGGTAADYGRNVTVDNDGNVYLAGNTASNNNIATAGAHQNTLGGSNDAFLAKFNSEGVRQWATYYGGTGTETGFSIDVDGTNNVYLTGLTASTNNIAVAGSYQPVKRAGNDAYLVKFNSNGVRQWSTYLGGNNNDNATSLKIDKQDNIYISGNTSSTNFPVKDALQPANGGGTDAFLTKFNSDGNLLWSTYYGNTGTENGRHINVGIDGFVYLSGITNSAIGIASGNVIQETHGGNNDAFLVKFTAVGKREWATYFGGPDNDVASASVSDALGKIYLVGAMQSPQMATPGSYQYEHGGGSNDVYLMSIDEKSSFILKQGDCVTLQYFYNTSQAIEGNYDFSFLLKTEKLFASDPDATIQPNATGFVGSQNEGDDVTVVHNAACNPGNKININVVIPQTVSCGDMSYTTATFTITNNSGMPVNNAVLHITLEGGHTKFASELYTTNPFLRFAKPNILHAAYPNTDNALLYKNGAFSISLYNIPVGISTIQIDLMAGSEDVKLLAYISDLPLYFNTGGLSNNVVIENSITITPAPVIQNWTYPATINSNEIVRINNVTITNAQTVQWATNTVNNITGSGTVTNPEITYTPSLKDIANGYIDFSLMAFNNIGCDATVMAHIPITNITYDYGDAPSSYDVNQSETPIAAAATLLSGLHLGKTAPSTEPQAKNSVNALGDGYEEDGYIKACTPAPLPGSIYKVPVMVTNNTTHQAFVSAFIDWDNNGNFLGPTEIVVQAVKINPQSGYTTQILSFQVPANIPNFAHFFIRLRLSVDSAAIMQPYGPAAAGEIEDHIITIGQPTIFRQQPTICLGSAFKVGSKYYQQTGNYIDTLAAANGCDSIVYTSLVVNTCGEDVCGPFIPNAFSPNGDNTNDVFGAIVKCMLGKFQLTVYNRWGQIVFQTNNPDGRWNGKVNGVLQKTDVYVWVCHYELNNQPNIKKGTVALIQ